LGCLCSSDGLHHEGCNIESDEYNKVYVVGVSADIDDSAKQDVGKGCLQVTGFSLLYLGPSRIMMSPTILNKAAVRNEGAIIVVVILKIPI
jgi:hypothetical protein